MNSLIRIILKVNLVLACAFIWYMFPRQQHVDRLAFIPPIASTVDNTIYDHEYNAQEWFNPNGFARGLHVLNQARIDYFYKVIKESFPAYEKRTSPLVVLDIGCGGGIGTEKLFHKDFETGKPLVGMNITGIEPSIRSVSVAKTHFQGTELYKRVTIENARSVAPSLQYFVGSAYDLSMYADESVDVIISSDVLDHLLDLRSAMKEVNRVLKKDGVFIFETINRTWKSFVWVQKLGELAGLIPFGTHDHRLFVTPSELHRLVEEESYSTMDIIELTGTTVNVGLGWSHLDLTKYISGFKFNYIWPEMKSASITDDDLSIGIIGFARKSKSMMEF
jgi:2-polyprenyl-6-hydroxyphenyl methylase/3-demethylubiquinone-9 3-methyltransferase